MKNAEAESAFKIWEKMAELEDIMWKHYYNEFLELCMELEQPECHHQPKNQPKSSFKNQPEQPKGAPMRLVLFNKTHKSLSSF
ncbi:MAG: hypothetical protein U9Q84_04220 [Thermodesulfobacteriota bacterium]|nr:hypothetical protein [Thermodesulfobacteriota bacterium]